MEPRTKYILTVISSIVAGFLFLGLGTYFFATLAGRSSSPQSSAGLLLGGGGVMVIGLKLVWRGIQLAKPLRETPQNYPVECPNCGALIENGAILCEKCKTEITEKPPA